MNACPECGGENGWERIARVRVISLGTWDTGTEDSIFDVVWKSSIIVCVDCGKRFKYMKIYSDQEIKQRRGQS